MQTVFVAIDVGGASSNIRQVNVSQIESIESMYPANKNSMTLITLLSSRTLLTDATVSQVMSLIGRAQDTALEVYASFVNSEVL